MPSRPVAITIGALVGLALGGAWLGLALSSSAGSGGGCPSGWSRTSAQPVEGATELISCVREQEPIRPRRSVVSLFRTRDGTAEALADRAVRSRMRAAGPGAAAASAAGEPSERGTAEGGRLATVSRTVDAEETQLEADVYLLAAGRRFGTLTVVHAPDAAFAQPRATAEWMSTITGLSPWGSPNAGDIAARCPPGFASQPVQGARAVVRCSQGLGSSQFVTLTLTWDDGGFGPEEDRAQVATAMTARAAQHRGPNARIVEGPVPFTLARNVDAIHTRLQTGESLPVSVRALAAWAPAGTTNVLATAISEPDVDPLPVLAAMLESGGYMRNPGARGSVPLAVAGLAILVALGAVAGALVTRPRPAG